MSAAAAVSKDASFKTAPERRERACSWSAVGCLLAAASRLPRRGRILPCGGLEGRPRDSRLVAAYRSNSAVKHHEATNVSAQRRWGGWGRAFACKYKSGSAAVVAARHARRPPRTAVGVVLLNVIDQFDLSEILEVYESADERGAPPYHPMMVATLLLVPTRSANRPRAVSSGRPAARSRQYRGLSAASLAGAGALVCAGARAVQGSRVRRAGQLALDGTKIEANAFKHKAMSYQRMCAKNKEPDEEVASPGAGKAGRCRLRQGSAGLRCRKTRFWKIRRAGAALEAEARACAE